MHHPSREIESAARRIGQLMAQVSPSGPVIKNVLSSFSSSMAINLLRNKACILAVP
jgi:hypothetical protein